MRRGHLGLLCSSAYRLPVLGRGRRPDLPLHCESATHPNRHSSAQLSAVVDRAELAFRAAAAHHFEPAEAGRFWAVNGLIITAERSTYTGRPGSAISSNGRSARLWRRQLPTSRPFLSNCLSAGVLGGGRLQASAADAAPCRVLLLRGPRLRRSRDGAAARLGLVVPPLAPPLRPHQCTRNRTRPQSLVPRFPRPPGPDPPPALIRRNRHIAPTTPAFTAPCVRLH